MFHKGFLGDYTVSVKDCNNSLIDIIINHTNESNMISNLFDVI